MSEPLLANPRRSGPRPRWLRLYYVLAAVNVVTLGAALYLAVHLVSTYAESVRVGQQWDARRDRFAELSGLAASLDAPANNVFSSNNIGRESAALDSAVPRLQTSVRALREEFRAIVRGPESVPFLQSLDEVDAASREVESHAREVFSELRSGHADRAASAMAAMDRAFARTNDVIRRAQFTLTLVRQREFRDEAAYAATLRRDVWVVAIASILTILGLAIYGWRLALTARRTAEEQAHQVESLRESESRYRVLNEALTTAQQRSHDARDAAEAANRLKTEFLGNVSHELRTPLNGMLGMLELAMDSGLTEAQLELLHTAHAASESLLGIINDILDFSTLEAGRMTLEPAEFGLRDTVSAAVATYARRARDKGLALDVDIAADLPNRLKGDARRLQRVVSNLIGNAIKFTTHGNVTLRLSADQRTASGIVLHGMVQDTGIGIAPDLQPLVFESFRQADNSTTRAFGGAGLGLPISRSLVELMGGRMWVESVPRVGSTFHFTVPLDVIADDATAVDPARVAMPRQLRVLVVEDNVVNQKVASSLLERDGHLVSLAENGREAVDFVANADFDLVLMDVQMPVMGGIDATRLIREWERKVGGHVVIIAVTARAMEGDREACIAAGMDDYLSKPVRAEELSAAIARLTGAAPMTATVAPASKAPTRASDDVFDEAELLRTVAGDHELVAELEGLFLEDVPKRLAAMRETLAHRDAAGLQAAAHALKGSAFTLTARKVAASAHALEKLAATTQLDGASVALAEVEHELQQLGKRLTHEHRERA